MEDMYAQMGFITIPREKEMAGALPDPIGRDKDGEKESDCLWESGRIYCDLYIMKG